MLRLSVVIPTYQRPVWVKRAVGSLARQSRVPDEVLTVARDTDEPTHVAIAELQATSLPFPLLSPRVSEPGFIPPVKAGLAAASGDVIAVLDDDAEALEGWAARLLAHYQQPDVGGVGGRVINVDGDVEQDYGETRRVGYVNALGQFIGDMYRRPLFTEPVPVAFMMGGCMSFRAEVARRLTFDMELNRNVAFGYEVDLGLQVRGMGWRLVFDPAIAVRHHWAPRPLAGMRAAGNTEATYWAAFNHLRVALRHLPWSKRVVATLYALAIGERRAPGLLPLGLAPVARRLGFQIDVAPAAVKGRLRALGSALRR